jgi:hypothetical protein
MIPRMMIAIKLKAMPSQFFFDNVSLKIITETKVDSVKMLRLLIGKSVDASSNLLLRALIIKNMVP